MDYAVAAAVVLLLTGWVAVDAARRGRNGPLWGVLVALTGGLGFIVWLVVRNHGGHRASPLGIWRGTVVFLSAIFLVLLSAIVAVFTIAFVLQNARVEGEAMAPTLATGDRVIVNKFTYQFDDPHVGEIVMLRYPLRPERTFVLRVAAEEGDQVQLRGGQVYRNDVPMEDRFVPVASRARHAWGPAVVPEGYYFVLADNRADALDSRHWGFVPKKYILGRVQLRWWPLSRMRTF